MLKGLIKVKKTPSVEELEEMYEFHEEYATKEKAEDIARCDGFKDYRIIEGHSCWHYLYNRN